MIKVLFRADLSALENLTRKYPEASREARVAKITECLLLVERETVRGTPYGAGPIHLREAWTDKVDVSGSKVVGIFGNPLEHGEPVEMGTKPHFPPTGPIQFWVEKKLGLSGKEAASAAFLIARAISRRGTKAVKMLEKAVGDNEGRLTAILQEIPGEIARRMGR